MNDIKFMKNIDSEISVLCLFFFFGVVALSRTQKSATYMSNTKTISPEENANFNNRTHFVELAVFPYGRRESRAHFKLVHSVA